MLCFFGGDDWQDTVLWNDLAGCCWMALQRGYIGHWETKHMGQMRVGMVINVTNFFPWLI